MKFPYQKLPIQSSYDSRQRLIARPLVPVYLVGKNAKTRSPYYALLDSGADRVMFPADLATEIGIADWKTGRGEQTVGIAGQRADVYYHPAAVRLLGDSKDLLTEVGFSDQIGLPILGRSFFAHFKAVVFAEPKEEVEFKN